jgi:hypothetical protein
MLGLALMLEGYTRGEAARLCAMERQTLRDWVIRYNAEGVGGAALVLPYANAQAMNLHLEAISSQVSRQSRRPSPRSSRMASDGRKAAGSKKHQPTSPATLFSRVEPRREYLAVPAI